MNDARKVRIVDVLQQRLRLDVPQSRMPVLMTAEEPPFHERDVHGGDGRRGLKTPAGSLERRYQRLLAFGFGVENVDDALRGGDGDQLSPYAHCGGEANLMPSLLHVGSEERDLIDPNHTL